MISYKQGDLFRLKKTFSSSMYGREGQLLIVACIDSGKRGSVWMKILAPESHQIKESYSATNKENILEWFTPL